jgi:hypothetical protein
MNGVSKRKRPDTESSEIESSGSDDIEYLEHNDKTASSADIARMVAALEETTRTQTSLIKELQTELTNTKTEQQNLKRQNAELQEQIDHLKAQVDSHSAPCPSTQPWASVVANGGGAEPRQPTSNVPAGTSATKNETLYCTIDISGVAEEDISKTTASAIRAGVEKEIRATEGHANWRCRAVTRDGKNMTRIKIVCRNAVEQQMVKRAAETKIAPGVRVLRDGLYPIKVNGVNRLAVLDNTGEIQPGVAEAFSHENETTVEKIVWLSNKDVPKAYGTMVVYVTKSSDARRFLTEGFFYAGGESGRTAVFERNFGPLQCYRCQELGHKQFECKNITRCARCAKEGHHHKKCSEAVVRCIPCGGPHESFSKRCPELYPAQHE